MGIHADLIDDDLDGIDPHEMSEHFRAVAALTKQQLSGMLGWAQQGQDRPVYEVAYALLEFRDCLAVRYVAHFTPGAWVNDYFIEVDAEGPQVWDCTAYALQHLDYLTRTAQWRDEPLDDPLGTVDNDCVFNDDPAAPDWVREWRGPSTIRIRRERQQPTLFG